MRAAVLHAFNEPLVVEEVRPVDLGPHELRARVEASGVCHSDLTQYRGGLGTPPPMILGHEGAATVLEVGAGVRRVAPGDRIITSFSAACGECWFCRHDRSNLCRVTVKTLFATRAHLGDGSPVTGMTGLGTFAEEVTLHEDQAVKVESDLPSEVLALIGCGVSTGVGAALNTAAVTPGATVAVIGCGGVGQSVIQGARIAGAARIFAVDPVEMKRTSALGYGATDPVDPAAGDPVQQVREATGGRGVDYAFEVIGQPATIVQAFHTARRGGTVVVVGMPDIDATVTLPAFGLMYDEKRVLGCLHGSSQVRRDFQRYVDLVETGRLDVGSMVTRRIGLDDVNDAFRAMAAGEVLRTVIV